MTVYNSSLQNFRPVFDSDSQVP